MDVPDVSVIVPTFRRPALLRRCLEALQAQTLWGLAGGEIIVVDNCPGESARHIVHALAAGRVPVNYIAEPRPGISHARNTGVAAARGALVAFVDDDNLVTETALSALRAALEETGCSAAFGRYVAVPETTCPDECRYFLGPYSRELGNVRKDVTSARAHLGTCLSLFRRPLLTARALPFDPALGLVGGEDSALLRELAERGHRFVFEPEALGFELVPLSRLNRPALKRRRFRAGQIRVANAGSASQRLLWMSIGAVQAAVHAPVAAMAGLLGQKERAETHWGQAWGGLGKLLWQQQRSPFYGSDAPPASAGTES